MLAVMLYFLDGVLHSMADLGVVLTHEEIIDEGQAGNRNDQDDGTRQTTDQVFHQANSKDDGHDSNDIENCVTHLLNIDH